MIAERQFDMFGIAAVAHQGEVLIVKGPLGEPGNVLARMSPDLARNFAYWLAHAYYQAGELEVAA